MSKRELSPDFFIPAAILGGGYSSDRQMPTQIKCLKDGELYQGGGSKAVIEMSGSVEFAEITRQLSVGVASTFNVGIFSQSLEDNYARYIQDASYSSAFYFYEQVQLPVQSWQPHGYGAEEALSDYGLGIYNKNKTLFRDICGDQFFQQAQQGGNLFATLKVNFNSKEDKSTFDNAIGEQKVDIVSATDLISNAAMQYQLDGDLEISAFQVGGEPGELSAIFSTSNAGYYFSNCKITNVTACNNVIDTMLAYAAEGFANQMDVVEGKLVGNVSPISYSFGSLEQGIGLEIADSIITPEITIARNYLAQLYSNMTNAQIELEHDLKTSAPQNFTALESQLNKVNANINILMSQNPEEGAIGCYFYPERCTEIEDSILGKLEPINE